MVHAMSQQDYILPPGLLTFALGSFSLMALAAAKDAVPAPTKTYGT